VLGCCEVLVSLCTGLTISMAVWTHIAHSSLSLPASSVTWTSISSSYDHLHIKMSARSSDTTGSTSTLTDSELQMGNGSVDTGTNYSDTALLAYGGSNALATRSTGQDTIQRIWIPSDSTTSDTFSVTNIWIPNYTASGYKQAVITSSGENNTTTLYYWGNILVAGMWHSTSAVTHLKLNCTVGNFMSQSSFDLYGIKGA